MRKFLLATAGVFILTAPLAGYATAEEVIVKERGDRDVIKERVGPVVIKERAGPAVDTVVIKDRAGPRHDDEKVIVKDR